MTNNILTLRMPARLTCVWVPTGNPRKPLACVWVDPNAHAASKEASSSNTNSGRLPLCA
jgi:hypothetical protein